MAQAVIDEKELLSSLTYEQRNGQGKISQQIIGAIQVKLSYAGAHDFQQKPLHQ